MPGQWAWWDVLGLDLGIREVFSNLHNTIIMNWSPPSSPAQPMLWLFSPARSCGAGPAGAAGWDQSHAPGAQQSRTCPPRAHCRQELMGTKGLATFYPVWSLQYRDMWLILEGAVWLIYHHNANTCKSPTARSSEAVKQEHWEPLWLNNIRLKCQQF